MKKIGYIYSYSKEKKEGTLVYGYYNGYISNDAKTICFKKEQCKENVTTGRLVYFDMVDDVVQNIEIASIYNFDRDLLLSLVNKYNEVFWNKGEEATHIRFKKVIEPSIVRIDIESQLKNNETDEYYLKQHPSEDSTLSLLTEEERQFLYNEDCDESDDYDDVDDLSFPFLDDEIEIYRIIDILSPTFWIPKKLKSINYYGKTANEIIDLYGILVQKRFDTERSLIWDNYKQKKTIDYKDVKILRPDVFQHLWYCKRWKTLLNSLSVEELRKIPFSVPSLQAALPISFYHNNFKYLYINAGFPNVKICKQYLSFRINTINTIQDYIELRNSIHDALMAKNINKKQIELLKSKISVECLTSVESKLIFRFYDNQSTNDYSLIKGYTLSHLSKRDLRSFTQVIHDKYSSFVKPRFNFLWNLTGCDDHANIEYLTYNRDYFLELSQFLEIITDPRSSFSLDWKQSYEFWNSYENFSKLNQEDQELLYDYYSRVINREFIKFSLTSYSREKLVNSSCILSKYKSFISEESIKIFASQISNQCHSISSFEELKYILELKLISEETIHTLVLNLVKDFSVGNLARFITESSSHTWFLRCEDLPIITQTYLLLRIVSDYGARKLKDGIRCWISEYNEFCDLEDFIRWLTELKSGQWGNINIPAIELAISKAVEFLSEDEINYLYNKKYLVKPGDKIDTWMSQAFRQLTDNIEYQRYKDSLY